MEETREQALSDLKIVDLSESIAGPFCTRLLAGFGAEVIKVEKPGKGDSSRSVGPFLKNDPNSEKSGLFNYLNTGKKSITLNLESKIGNKILNDLINESDILVESYSPGVMASLGLSYELLKDINPRLIMASVSGFGQNGPYRDYKSGELIAQAMGGLLYCIGDVGSQPIKLGGSQAEYSTGLLTFIAILGALCYRDNNGVGQYIDISLMESVAATLGPTTISTYSFTGIIGGRGIKRFILGHPSNVYPCKDGYIHVIPLPGGMPSLALLLGDPDLEKHPLFIDHVARQMHADEFDDIFLLPWLNQHKKREIEEKAQELRMTFYAVRPLDEILEAPQLRARDFLVNVNHPVLGEIAYPGAPFKMSGSPWHLERSPLLGEHNEEIYCQRLSYTQEDLIKLKELAIM